MPEINAKHRFTEILKEISSICHTPNIVKPTSEAPNDLDHRDIISEEGVRFKKEEKHINKSLSDIKTESSPNHDTDTHIVEIPHNMSWEDTQLVGRAVSFLCVSCNNRQNLQIGLFAKDQPRHDKGPIQTSQVINYGKTITGNVVAFIVALVVGLIISLASGKTGTGIAIIYAAIFLILRKILVPTFMDKLPIWVHECSNCRNKIYIASDGNNVSIGKAQET